MEYVFDRPQYTGQEGWVEPSKKYTCCNCGVKLEKSKLADHAGECQGNKETYLEQTWDKSIKELNEMELMKSVKRE